MSVPVRPAAGPINLNAFAAGLAGSTAWWLWSSSAGETTQAIAAGLCSAAAAPLAARVLVLMGRDFKLRRNLRRAAEASHDHGTAREADWAEIVAREMDNPASGNFVGLYRGKHPAFAPPRTPFSLNEMPPGTGKTVNFVIGSILHQARLGKSLFVPDVKCELAPMLVPALRRMGVETWCINPAKAHMDPCGDTEINLYQPVIDACHAKDDFRRDTIKLSLDFADLHLPEPKDGDSKNIFFRNGARRCIAVGILSQALIFPAACTPSDVFALLGDPQKFRHRLLKLRYEIVRLLPGDPIAAFLQTESANLFDKFENNAEHAASFLEAATQTLISFNQGGRMAGYGRTASVNIADMRRRQIAVFVMSPLSHTRDFAPVVSLLNHSLLEISKRQPAGHHVHIVGEEALNYRFADLVSDMETMRGLKISADFYIQSFSGLVRKYGRDAAAAIEAYADVKIYAGLTSLDRARHVSDMLAEATIRRQDYSYKADATDIGVSSRELGRRLMTADEVLSMPRGDAWVFVRGMRPMRVAMAHYGRIAPWRDEVGANPLEGSALKGETAFAIRYGDKAAGGKVEVEGGPPAPPKQARKRRRFVSPVRLRHMFWLPPLLALWSIGPLDVPLPHLRWSYERAGTFDNPVYRRCTYAGARGRTIFPESGACPFIRFFSSR